MNYENIRFKLMKYYEDLNEISFLLDENKELKNQYKRLEMRLRTNDYGDLDDGVRAIDYTQERIKTSSVGDGPALTQMCKIVEKIEYSKETILNRIALNCSKINDLKLRIVHTSVNLKKLTDEEISIIEKRFKYNKSAKEVAKETSYSRTWYYQVENKILDKIKWILKEEL